jgi:hypothetical protein
LPLLPDLLKVTVFLAPLVYAIEYVPGASRTTSPAAAALIADWKSFGELKLVPLLLALPVGLT